MYVSGFGDCSSIRIFVTKLVIRKSIDMIIGAFVSVSLIITADVIDIALDVASLYGLVKITFSTEYSKY